MVAPGLDAQGLDAQDPDDRDVATPAAAGAVEAAIPRRYNFAEDILARNLAAGRAGKPAYIDPRGTWTYGQLGERVARFGKLLRSLGMAREQRILICLTDTIDWPTAFLGAVKAGVVAVPLSLLTVASVVSASMDASDGPGSAWSEDVLIRGSEAQGRRNPDLCSVDAIGAWSLQRGPATGRDRALWR
jgi:non-ribosomal peptide synthetase component F